MVPGDHGVVALKLVQSEQVPLQAVVQGGVSFAVDSEPYRNF